MHFRDHAAAVLAGAVAGVAGGLFGVGGGLVLVPALTGFFHLDQRRAHGTSLAAIGVAALASVAVYASHRNVEWLTAAVVGIGSVYTARLGARWAAVTSNRTLARSFAIFLVAVALRLLWRAPAASGMVAAHGITRVALDLAIGAAVGLLSGFMGVGGGLLAVPAFTLLLGMTQQAAQGTSLAVIIVTAPAGAIEHARHGNVAGGLVPGLALGAALAGPLASWAAQGLPHELLVRCFAVFMLVNGVHTWIRASRTS